jgi:hypothetical protein
MAVCSSRSGTSGRRRTSPAITPMADAASVRPSSTLSGTMANSAPFFTCSTLLENSGRLLFQDSRSTSGRMVLSSTVVLSCGSQMASWRLSALAISWLYSLAAPARSPPHGPTIRCSAPWPPRAPA